MSSNK
jgi:hypothetical protein